MTLVNETAKIDAADQRTRWRTAGRTFGSYRFGYTRRGPPRGLTLPQAQADLQIVIQEAEGM